jgi:hypothetical protein
MLMLITSVNYKLRIIFGGGVRVATPRCHSLSVRRLEKYPLPGALRTDFAGIFIPQQRTYETGGIAYQ